MNHPYTYPEHRHPWYVGFSYKFLRFTLGPIVRLIWIKKVHGKNNIPKEGPLIFAFNHQSYFDFLCFIAVCPRTVHFLSAEKFFLHKIWRPLMLLTGQIRVDRQEHDKSKLHITVYDHLKNGKVIGIFPEGTRAYDPVEMMQAFTGVAKYAVGGEVPIVPVGITGTYHVMSRHDRKPKFKKIIEINIGKPVHFSDHYKKNLSENDYRKLTDIVMREISLLSGKRYSHFLKTN